MTPPGPPPEARAPEAPQGRGGFTLLEVLAAVLVAGLLLGFFVELVSDPLRLVGDARNELEASRIADGIVRRLVIEGEQGTVPEVGTIREEAPTTPSQLPYVYEQKTEVANPEFDRKLAENESGSSPIFSGKAPGSEGPALVRVEIRVFREDIDPDGERATPHVIYLSQLPEIEAPPEGSGPGPDGEAQETEQ